MTDTSMPCGTIPGPMPEMTSQWAGVAPPVHNSQVSTVSAFFPCYNDAATIEVLVRRVAEVLGSVTSTFEVIVVDDGSHDGSLQLLRALERELAYLRVVAHDVNRGYGAALLSGFRAARYEWVFYTDGDGQYDPAEVSTLIRAVGPATDIVQGWKLSRGDSWYRKVIGRMYHHVVAYAFSLNVRDTDCDFRLFRRRLLEPAALRSTSGVICVEMMRRFQDIGAQFTEVPVHHYFRPHGRSQFFRFSKIARSGFQLGQLWSRLVLREALSSTAAAKVTPEQRPPPTRAGRSKS
jgi:glycosyltransferase involved in cell wall biosynthesis